MRIPPLYIKILLESNPPKSRILVRRLAVTHGLPTGSCHPGRRSKSDINHYFLQRQCTRNTKLRVNQTLYANKHVFYSAHVYSAHIPGQRTATGSCPPARPRRWPAAGSAAAAIATTTSRRAHWRREGKRTRTFIGYLTCV